MLCAVSMSGFVKAMFTYNPDNPNHNPHQPLTDATIVDPNDVSDKDVTWSVPGRDKPIRKTATVRNLFVTISQDQMNLKTDITNANRDITALKSEVFGQTILTWTGRVNQVLPLATAAALVTWGMRNTETAFKAWNVLTLYGNNVANAASYAPYAGSYLKTGAIIGGSYATKIASCAVTYAPYAALCFFVGKMIFDYQRAPIDEMQLYYRGERINAYSQKTGKAKDNFTTNEKNACEGSLNWTRAYMIRDVFLHNAKSLVKPVVCLGLGTMMLAALTPRT